MQDEHDDELAAGFFKLTIYLQLANNVDEIMKQSILLLLATILSTTAAFQTGGSISSSRCNGALFSAVADEQETAVKNDLLKRDRYVATNRFTVRPGRAAKFEKRWGELLFPYCNAIVVISTVFVFI